MATFDLQYVLRDTEEWQKAKILAELNNEDGRCIILVSYPIMAANEKFSGTRSILRIHKLHDLVAQKVLPLYFGESITFLDYQIANNELIASFNSDSAVSYIKERVIPITNLKPVRIKDSLKWQVHELTRDIDSLIANSTLKNTYRLSYGHRVFTGFRLRESTFSIDHFHANMNHTMIRLCLLATTFYNGSQAESIQWLRTSLGEYLSKDRNVIDHRVCCSSTWERKTIIETRLIV